MAFNGRAPTVALNEVYDHPYVRVNVLLDQPSFVAGRQMTGIVEVACSSNKVLLGEISLELLGTENLISSDHVATRVFLREIVFFQSKQHGLPPSNAVQGDPVGEYWPARKGRCRFSWAFTLPDDAPTSTTFAGNADLKYTLKVTAQAQCNRERSLVTRAITAQVVEHWVDYEHADFWEPVQDEASERPTFAGSSGAVSLRASLPRRLYWRSIDPDIGPRHDRVELNLHVRNTTTRAVSGIRVALCRRLRVLPPPGKRAVVLPQAPLVTESISENPFIGRQYDFLPGDERSLLVPVDLPQGAATIRKTTLFAVDMICRITLSMGMLSKDLVLELPISAGHAESMPSRAHHMPLPSNGVQLRHDRSLSPLPSPRLPCAQQNGAFSPMLSPSSPQPYVSFSPLPSPYDAPLHPAGLPLPYARPPQSQNGYIDFDPVAPDLTASRVLDAQPPLHQPLHWPGLDALARSTPALRQPPSVVAARPLPTPTPGPIRPRSAASSPVDRRAVEATAARYMSPEDRDIILANLAPVPGYSGTARAGPNGAEEVRRSMAIRRSSAPVELPLPEASGHTLQRSHSAADLTINPFRPSATPPPLAPSSRFHTPPTVIPIHELDRRQQATHGLDTIGEAGESRIGTLVSVPSQLEAYVEAQELAEALENSSARVPTAPLKPTSHRRTSLPTAMEIFADPPRSKTPEPSARQRPSPPMSPLATSTFEPLPVLPRTTLVASPSEGLLALTARLSRPTTPSITSPPPPSSFSPKKRPALERSGSSSGLLIAKASERSLRTAYLAANPPLRPIAKVTAESLREEAATRVGPWLATSASSNEPTIEAKSESKEAEIEVQVTTTKLLQQGLREVLADALPKKSSASPPSTPAAQVVTLASAASPVPATPRAIVRPPAEVSRTDSPELMPPPPVPSKNIQVCKLPRPTTSTATKGKAKQDDEPPKYDARSARGGRGGVVTSVAAQWAGIVARSESGAEKGKPAIVKPVALRFDAKKMPPMPSQAKGGRLQDLFKAAPSAAATSTHPPFTPSSLPVPARLASLHTSTAKAAPKAAAPPYRPFTTANGIPTSPSTSNVADILARTRQDRQRKRLSEPLQPKAIPAKLSLNMTLTRPADLAPPSVLVHPTPRRASDVPAVEIRSGASKSTSTPVVSESGTTPKREGSDGRGQDRFAALLAKYSQAAGAA